MVFVSRHAAYTLSGVAILAGILGMVGCSSRMSGDQGKLSAQAEYRLSSLDVNMYPSHKTVCDPWGGDPDPRSNSGLKAELYYLLPDQQKYSSATDVIANGHKSDQNLFFNALNVPTRRFEHGFINDLGEAVKDDNKQTLVEYFALRFKSVLKLAPDQEPGLYELGVLSDDGSIVRLRDEDGVYREYINNDGTHTTKMGCSSQAISLERDTEKMIQVDYHQGPRHHIALVLMMRKVTDLPGKDPACGQEGNDAWFDYSKSPSVPKAKYNDLLARGWKPLSRDNFSLPNQAVFNPCKEGIVPNISGFRINESGSTGFMVSWQTDIPATSQLAVLDPATGETTLTVSDNVLRTSHSVTVLGLKPSTPYTLMAVSISDTYGKGMSAPINTSTEP